MSEQHGAARLGTVRVSTGLLAGVPGADPSLTVFKGVPFAAPPVGELRWRPPAPPASWDGLRTADTFGPICPQLGPPPGSFYHQEFYLEPEPRSEDCLYLNVWTGAASAAERRPVMVWFHGGALLEGSGSLPSFHGEALARKGVVLVTANYRLGPLGYLAHPALSAESEHGASGNYGLLDQVAALRWVRENIAAFGGDPQRVTIFGQSAGATSVFALISSPLAEGLVTRAIGQSGNLFNLGRVRPLKDLERTCAERAEQRWGARTAAELRALSPETLLGDGTGNFGFYGLAVDGYALTEDPAVTVAEGRHHAGALIVGATANEWTPMAADAPITVDSFRRQVEQLHGQRAAELLELYPAASDAEARLAQVQSGSDGLFAGQRAWAAAQQRSRPGTAYVYYFDRRLPGRNSEWYGAFHSGDLYYVFGTLASTDRPWTEADRRLADAVTSYWASFAAAGDPNTPGLPAWPAFDEREMVMRLGERIAAEPSPHPERIAFFERGIAAR